MSKDSLPLEMMSSISLMPHAAASSTTYCSTGLSTRGISSLGTDLAKGRKRVPKPAAGMTALVIFFIVLHSMGDDLRLDDFDTVFFTDGTQTPEHGFVFVCSDNGAPGAGELG